MADRERETIVQTDRGGGGGVAAALILAVVILIAVFFFFGGTSLFSGSGTKTIKADVDIHGPSTGGSGQ